MTQTGQLAHRATLFALVILLFSDSIVAQDRVQRWNEDLDTLVFSFLPKDLSFSSGARERFKDSITRLRKQVERISDQQVIVNIASAVALSQNAHTRLYLVRNRSSVRRYPIRVYWFGNTLHVLKAKAECRDLLGSRVIAINGRPIEKVRERVSTLYAGNPSWQNYMSTFLLTSPDILIGLGIVKEPGEGEFTLQLPSGQRIKQVLHPMPLEPSDKPTEAWWDLSPLHPGRFGPWLSFLPADTAKLPLYLRTPTQCYWFERLASANAMYIQYNRASENSDGESFSSFSHRLLDELSSKAPEKVIVDLRFNTGGNLQIADSLFSAMSKFPFAQERNRLFVITGRQTFSAGIYHAAQLKQLTKAYFVGEPVGDNLDYWSEGGNVVLPHSGLTVHFANGYHGYSQRRPPAGVSPYRELEISSLAPDRIINTRFEDYMNGRDPAMEFILGF